MKTTTLLIGILFLLEIFGQPVMYQDGAYPFNYTIQSIEIDIKIQDQKASTIITQRFHTYGIDTAYLHLVYPENGSLVTIVEPDIIFNNKPVTLVALGSDTTLALLLKSVEASGNPSLLNLAGMPGYKTTIAPRNDLEEIIFTYSTDLKCQNGLCEYQMNQYIGDILSTGVDSFRINVDIQSSAAPLVNLYSPSHHILFNRESAIKASGNFFERGYRPSQDIKIYYSLSEDKYDFKFLHYNNNKEEDGYFVGLLAPQYGLSNTKIVAKDFIFVIDRSGSMSGYKMDQAKEALLNCLQALNNNDRFNIVDFSSDITSYKNEMMTASASVINDAVLYGQGISAGGGTDINGSLLAGLELFENNGRPKYIIFLTDGQATSGITDRLSIVNNIKTANTLESRIYAFGVGSNVNTFLLDDLSSQNGGISVYVNQGDNIQTAVSSFFAVLSSPLLTGIEIDYGNAKAHSIYPRELPDIFSSSQLILVGRVMGSGSSKVLLNGSTEGKGESYSYNIDFPALALSNTFIPKIWASKSIDFQIAELRTADSDQSDSLILNVEALGSEYGVVTQYTSYQFTTSTYTEWSGLGEVDTIGTFSTGDETADFYLSSVSSGDAMREALSDSVGILANYNASYANSAVSSGTYRNFQVGNIKNINEKTFITDSNGVWVDNDLNVQDSIIEIEFASDDYIQMALGNPGMGAYLAISKNVLVEYAGSQYFIHDSTIQLKEDFSSVVNVGPTNNKALVSVSPNPFNPATHFSFSTGGLAVNLQIFNMKGQLVHEAKKISKGKYLWQVKNLPAGMYFFRAHTRHIMQSGKLILKK